MFMYSDLMNNLCQNWYPAFPKSNQTCPFFILCGFSQLTFWNQNKMHHSFTPLLSLIYSRWQLPQKRLLDSNELVMSHAADFIYLKTAPCCCTMQLCPSCQCCSVQAKSEETLRWSHFRTCHESLLWIMSSTCFPPLPTLSTACLPHPSSHP